VTNIFKTIKSGGEINTLHSV